MKMADTIRRYNPAAATHYEAIWQLGVDRPRGRAQDIEELGARTILTPERR